MQIEWLPEEIDEHGRGRPFRPDLPWLRNLSWVKLHAIQIGFGLAIIVYWGQMINQSAIAFAVTIVFANVVLGKAAQKSRKTSCDHNLGAHDLRRKPWYAIISTVVVWGLLTILFGVP